MNRYLKAVLDNSKTLEWEQHLGPLQLSYNTAVHKTTLETPFFMTYGCDANMPYFDLDKPDKIFNIDTAAEKFLLLQKSLSTARENSQEAAWASERYHNKRAKLKLFKPGDKVLLHTPTSNNQNKNVKFLKYWTPYVVTDIHANNTATIKATPNSKPQTVNIDCLKLLSPELTEISSKPKNTENSVTSEHPEEPIAHRRRSKKQCTL